MNRKRLILLAIVVVLAICISIAFHSWNKAQQEKDAEAKYALLEEYNYAGGTLHMEANTSEYDKQEIPMILS